MISPNSACPSRKWMMYISVVHAFQDILCKPMVLAILTVLPTNTGALILLLVYIAVCPVQVSLVPVLNAVRKK